MLPTEIKLTSYQKMTASPYQISKYVSHLNPENILQTLTCATSLETTNRLGELLHIDGFNPGAGTPRDMTLLETISASWIICNSWAGIAATISLAITLGGPAILIYGPIVVFVLVGCCAVTLAELASVYPTAGGQYHWTSILAPKKVSRGLVSECICHKLRIVPHSSVVADQLMTLDRATSVGLPMSSPGSRLAPASPSLHPRSSSRW